MELTITAKQLRSLLEPMLPLTTAFDVPVLNGVRLHTSGGNLYATASDRFVLGIKRLTGTYPDGFECILGTDSARTLLRSFKPGRYDDPELTLRIDGDRLWVETFGGFDGFEDARVAFRMVDGEYPKMGAVITKAEEKAEPGELARYSFASLAKFKAFDAGDGLTIRTHQSGAAIITNGEDFVGAIMPRRPAEGMATLADCLTGVRDLLEPPAAPKPAPKKRAARKAAAS